MPSLYDSSPARVLWTCYVSNLPKMILCASQSTIQKHIYQQYYEMYSMYSVQAHLYNNQSINKTSIVPISISGRAQSLAWSYAMIEAKTGPSTGSRTAEELGWESQIKKVRFK